uniref:Uncharacterized protein n=1 Tax=Strigamia maritima TaxID=126957 RepID=T1JKN7_STRMM
MVLRFLIRYIANNEQLIEKLSQSYPIRRAAQLTAYLFTKGKYKGEEMLKSGISKSITEEAEKAAERLKSFSGKFKEEYIKGRDELKKNMRCKTVESDNDRIRLKDYYSLHLKSCAPRLHGSLVTRRRYLHKNSHMRIAESNSGVE